MVLGELLDGQENPLGLVLGSALGICNVFAGSWVSLCRGCLQCSLAHMASDVLPPQRAPSCM